METVSAIPEHLFSYSGTCTQGAEQFQTWIRMVLAPALREYEMSPGAVTCSVLDTDVAEQVAAAYYTDRNVRRVGQAFLETQRDVVTVRTPTMPVFAQEKAVQAAYDRLGQPTGQSSRTPNPRPGQSPGPSLLSHELEDAHDYTLPYVDADGSRYSPREDAVLSWIEAHRDVIVREARLRGISPKAIAAAIAWEALENVQPAWPVPPGTKLLGVRISQRWVGPGKVHFIDSPLVEQVEAQGYLPRASVPEREAILATDEGSIRYIAAIMGAIADTTDRVPAYRSYNARENVALLTHVYQGGGPAKDLTTWETHLRGNHGRKIIFANDMAQWAASHQSFLDEAMRPWQPGDGPPPHLTQTPPPRLRVTPAPPTPGPSPRPT
ncbi:hypothetical protein J2Z21_008633 [Streptomyces griseochromogenes]|uniref:Uncharacterized protein n=1 Tax=Streptomyces griseochromogenes TaxID=68214 RepID=A0A1B1B0A7_9ACTN|nr:hypothetical protein [Streptomyces griseochromogenes]ANP52273.1 hypothetical protein AVL59_24405 [Streptomyces griseochromogenes]MBP2055617.1 hypothetical protein [Streptomyces griseochromogenes]